VNLTDFNILSVNFGQSPRDFSQADFTYDSIVNLDDFNVLASRFGTTLSGGRSGATDDAGVGGAIRGGGTQLPPLATTSSGGISNMLRGGSSTGGFSDLPIGPGRQDTEEGSDLL
jgi:hypothetical protein